MSVCRDKYAARRQGLTAVPVSQGMAAVETITTDLPPLSMLLHLLRPLEVFNPCKSTNPYAHPTRGPNNALIRDSPSWVVRVPRGDQLL